MHSSLQLQDMAMGSRASAGFSRSLVCRQISCISCIMYPVYNHFPCNPLTMTTPVGPELAWTLKTPGKEGSTRGYCEHGPLWPCADQHL